MKVRTTNSNPSYIFAEGFYEIPKCIVKNMNKIGFIHGECGMSTKQMVFVKFFNK